MGLFSFDVHAGFLAFLPVLIQKFEKLDHFIIYEVIMDSGVELGLVEQRQEFVESHHFFIVKDDPVQQIVIKNLHCCFLSEQLDGILQSDVALLPFVDFVELL